MRPTRLPACLVAALLLPAVACGSDGPAMPGATDADLTVLFVGNSLTFVNDLPGAVTTVAEAAGRDVAVAMVAHPNYALEDHWHRGIGAVIREISPDVVVMQQGPSSLPENQAHLAAWSDTLSRVIREAGADPALLMVWPDLSRAFAFDDVRDSYRNAALGVEGTFIPAGEALRALHQGHPDRSPFGADGFHPNDTGTVLAAYVTVGTLLGVEVTGLPAGIPAGSRGGRAIALSAEDAAVLQGVADSVVAAWR